jgi:Nucleoside-diphosphate-sugar epimerases
MQTTQTALVTGGAGFIGSHLVDRLLADGWRVITLDNFEPYYDPAIKRVHVSAHLRHPAFRLIEADLRDAAAMAALPGEVDVIVHLAAKAGVRASLADPVGYQQTNIIGLAHLLEYARRHDIRRFVFGSSSSVYGDCPRLPWREDDPDLVPINPYASTKLAGEQLGRVYASLFGLRLVALRFFTVFGPRQRPDLAIHKFSRLILDGRPIPVFGDGSMERDYTYVDDIVAGICAAIERSAAIADGAFEAYNLGNSRTIRLDALIAAIEQAVGRRAIIERLPEQPGEMRRTWADIARARELLGFAPRTPLEAGLPPFVAWLHRQRATEAAQA